MKLTFFQKKHTSLPCFFFFFISIDNLFHLAEIEIICFQVLFCIKVNKTNLRKQKKNTHKKCKIE